MSCYDYLAQAGMALSENDRDAAMKMVQDMGEKYGLIVMPQVWKNEFSAALGTCYKKEPKEPAELCRILAAPLGLVVEEADDEGELPPDSPAILPEGSALGIMG
jgi:hypothetical protein